jgi:ABC-type Zn uptake system ZnuABC Zn-binding protein ZnuA
MKILTTFAPIHSWTLNVAGPDAAVDLLLPGDVGPHDFQLRPQDLRRIRQADFIIANGLGMETWLDKAIRNNPKGKRSRVIRTSDGLKSQLIYHLPVLSLDPAKPKKGGGGGDDHEHGHSHDAAGEAPNPHVWLDPVLACHGVSNIISALAEADPKHSAGYRKRGQEYIARLELLDREMRTAVQLLPHKAIVTFHDAFPYFCRRYQLQLVGVIEETPSVEPSPRYLASLSATIRARGVRGIFTEPQFNPRLVKQLSEDLGVRFGELDVLETGSATPEFYELGLRRNLKSLESTLR